MAGPAPVAAARAPVYPPTPGAPPPRAPSPGRPDAAPTRRGQDVGPAADGPRRYARAVHAALAEGAQRLHGLAEDVAQQVPLPSRTHWAWPQRAERIAREILAPMAGGSPEPLPRNVARLLDVPCVDARPDLERHARTLVLWGHGFISLASHPRQWSAVSLAQVLTLVGHNLERATHTYAARLDGADRERIARSASLCRMAAAGLRQGIVPDLRRESRALLQ